MAQLNAADARKLTQEALKSTEVSEKVINTIINQAKAGGSSTTFSQMTESDRRGLKNLGYTVEYYSDPRDYSDSGYTVKW